jgi:hypothetical protein
MNQVSRLLCCILFLALVAAMASAGVSGSISGTVTDPAGRVIPRTALVALHVETGVRTTTVTNAHGFYSFPSLPVGHYTVQIQANGFSRFAEKGLVLDVDSALRVCARLQVSNVADHHDIGFRRASGHAKHADGRTDWRRGDADSAVERPRLHGIDGATTWSGTYIDLNNKQLHSREAADEHQSA